MERLKFEQSTDKASDELIAAAREGSTDALGRMLDECRHYLLLVANHELDSQLQAKLGASDLVQDTFLEAQRDFNCFHGRTEAELLAWLRQILLNNMRDAAQRYHGTAKRQVSREVPLSPLDDTSGYDGETLPAKANPPSWPARQLEQSSAIESALEQLPEDYREIVELRNFQLLDFADIGRQMNRSADASRKLWSRAIKVLEQRLSELND